MNALLFALIITVAVFVFVLTLLSFLQREKRQVQKRIDTIAAANKVDLRLQQKLQRKRGGADDSKLKMLKRLENDLSMSGILIRPSEFLLIWIGLALVPSSLLLIVSHNLILAVIALVIGVVIPPYYVHRKQAKRVELFEQQLVDAIGIMSSCLKAGLTFQQALVSISTEMPEPISSEFGRVVKELKLGSTIETSLTKLSEKINSQNFMMIVSAILIQRQTGGNLSEILTNISGTIKERFKIKNEIKVLTATGRTSGMVVGLMPIFIILIFLLFNPSYVTIFFESNLGITMLVVAVAMEIIGYLVIRKIVNIKF
jgi:tight adherence protein B